MALRDDGSFYIWGCNRDGQICHYPAGEEFSGSARDSCISTPIFPCFTGSDFVRDIFAGSEHSFASVSRYTKLGLDDSSGIYSWGKNHYGQLGNGEIIDKPQFDPRKIKI